MSSEVPSAPLAERVPRRAALLAHFRVPLYRDGYALVLNAGLTGLLGVVFWLVAARGYSPRIVGINTAAIAAMMFLAGVAQLNLMSTMLRFVPVLGAGRRRFIAGCYLVAGCAAVGCATVFLLGVHIWAPALRGLVASPGSVVWFVAATLVWCVFNLQDSALTGLGAAVLVPVENAVYAVAKIVLLVVFASASPHWGIFGSWTAALVFSLVPINLLIFGPLLRSRQATSQAAVEPPTRADIVQFAGPDFLGDLLRLAALTLMPVIVVAIAGATSNAYFSLAWMVTMPLWSIDSSTGAALVVRAAAEPARLSEYARDVLRQTARMVVPAAIVVAIGAPYLLRLFGHQYESHSATTLALLALSSIPQMITSLYVSIYRVQRRMRAVVTLLAAKNGSVLALSPVLLALMGVSGVGLAWLVTQSVAAAGLLVMDPGALRRADSGALDS